MNRNRTFRKSKTIAATLCITLAANLTFPVSAAEKAGKDENIYVNLNQDGSVANIYVVNEYMLDEETEIQDYGDYSAVKNLTTDKELKLEDGKVTVQASKGKFLYQGTLENAVLPWNIQISYKLDGKEISAKELPGKSGKLAIKVSVKDNPESDDTFFDNYLMQASVTLNTDKCSSIKAEGATEANVGKNRQLLYNIMAGQEKTFTVSADVTDFEMQEISFQAVPMSFDLDDGAAELRDGVDELLDGAGELKDGAKELAGGSSELLSGTKELSYGASSLNSGMGSLKSGTNSLNKGISSVHSGAGTLNKGAKDLSNGAKSAVQGSQDLKQGTDSLSTSLNEMEKAVMELNENFALLVEQSPNLTEGSERVLGALQEIQRNLSSIQVGTEEIQELLSASSEILQGINDAQTGAGAVSGGLNEMTGYNSDIDSLKAQNSDSAAYIRNMAGLAASLYAAIPPETAAEYTGGVDVDGVLANAENVACLLEQNSAVLGSLQSGINSVAPGAEAVSSGLTELQTEYQKFDAQIQNLPVILDAMVTEKMQPLKEAIDELTDEYAVLDQGIGEYTLGAEKLKEGYEALYEALLKVAEGAGSLSEGAGALVKGASELAGGANELYKGTQSLQSGTSQLVSGAGSLNNGAGSLYNGSSQLYSGARQVDDGAGSLESGLKELYDGTKEFVEKTDDIDTKIDDEIEKAIDEFSGSGYQPVSFVSEKNDNIDLVQFVMQTGSITIPEEEEPQEEEKEESFFLH